MTIEDTKEFANFASIDVSFISLKLVLPKAKELVSPDGHVVALIKPQFEAGREKVGKKGVVRDIEVHLEVVNKIVNFLIENDFNVLGLSFSPIKGPEGNREYLVYFTKDKEKEGTFELSQIDDVVRESHSQL